MTDFSPNSPDLKHVDLLDEDSPLAGQKYACISFVSPEDIIKSKEVFFFDKFTKAWGLTKSLEKYTQFTQFLAHKYRLNYDNLSEDFKEFCSVEKEQLVKDGLTVHDEYLTFVDKNEDSLQEEYDQAHNFQTSTRGIKIRGCFSTQGEAELRAKLLREQDPHHNVYVGPVGIWLPFNPAAYKTGRTEYLENELNDLMHEKKKNEDQATQEFNKRVKDAKAKAIADNISRAKETGAKLTQTLNADGNLVSAQDVATFDNVLDSCLDTKEYTESEVQEQLFSQNNLPEEGREKLHKDYSIDRPAKDEEQLPAVFDKETTSETTEHK